MILHRSIRSACLTTAMAWLALLVASPAARAMDGDELIGIGAVQRGTAGAGMANPKDAAWAFLNPASIVDLERRFDIGADIFWSRRTAEPKGPLLTLNLTQPQDDLIIGLVNPGAGTLRDNRRAYSPAVGLIWPFERSALGFGVFGVQGNNVRYPRSRTLPGLQDGGGDRRAQLEVAKIPLTYAYRFDNGWSAGVAFLGVHNRLRTDSLTLGLRTSAARFGWDTSLGYGFKAGVYKRWEKAAFGAAYTTRQWNQPFDKYEDLMLYNLDHPQQFQAGIAYFPSEKWEFALDYKFIDWSGISTTGKDTIYGGLGWNDQNIVKAGVTWNATRRFTLRAGVSHGKAPIPGDSVFSNVLFPAIAETHLAAGCSFDLNERHAVHMAFVHALKNEMVDTGTGDLFSLGGRGTRIALEQNVLSIQYSWKF